MKKNSLRYIYKIHSSRLKSNGWNLALTPESARKDKELVSLADSQLIRFINVLSNYKFSEEKITGIKERIKSIKKQDSSIRDRNELKRWNEFLDKNLLIKDYICVVMANEKDFKRANEGFQINDVKFKRLFATSGGAKDSTVIYVSEKIYAKLFKKIENCRDLKMELVAGKLEAYRALTATSSVPVPDPKGVLVVKDFINKIVADVFVIDDTNEDKEFPEMYHVENKEIDINNNDGYGLIHPDLAEAWGKHLGLDYIPSYFRIRNSFCKGMLYTFPYEELYEKIGEGKEIIDAWTKLGDIKSQIILTTSMLKLWSSFNGVGDYLDNCKKNGYTFSVNKVAPETLENERNLNYQFIQSLDLSNSDIDDLIEPTIAEIRDIRGLDYRKSILFLKGTHLNEESTFTNDCVKALSISPEMINDPFIIDKINKQIEKRITKAKTGSLKVKGNLSAISGDPYILCESIFGIEKPEGLLKKGQFYSKYFMDKNIDKVAAFRSPMTCHNNIRVLRFDITENDNTKEMKYWYRYMKTCTIFNAWDTTTEALNNCDMDGDEILCTANPTLLKSIVELDAIACVQKKAKAIIVKEEDSVKANLDSFGDDIGSITSKITTMFDVRSKFEKGSWEYDELSYRICCGQLLQGNAIDKTKGIISKPMSKMWYDKKANEIIEGDGEEVEGDSDEVKLIKENNLKILANKSPYFLNYRYPEKMKEYKKFKVLAEANCIINYGLTVKELEDKKDKTEDENNFLKYYYLKNPSSMNESVMNKICFKIEEAFVKKNRPKGGYKNNKVIVPKFDYSILMTDKEINEARYADIKVLYEKYIKETQEYSQKNKGKKVDSEEKENQSGIFREKFKKEAYAKCNNTEELTNIVVKICYSNGNSKQFAWDICGKQIIKTLLNKHNGLMSFPVPDENGDIEFNGERFKMITKNTRESEMQNENSI